ncbi:MAG TPA: glycosyltransferase family 1 protein [Thermoanaerobaculia bacterium]|jgi:glycosyltransferase involved in cell wall biosynthesis
MTMIRVGIDASNLRAGGGITHLVELLRHAEPRQAGVDRVTVWGAHETLDRLAARDWLTLAHEPALEGSLTSRVRWQRGRLRELAREHCDVLFVPGGGDGGGFRPYVTMFRNMLPFQWRERARYHVSPIGIRLWLLHFAQKRAFRRADAVIFLNEFARQRVGRYVARSAVIPHGVSDDFRLPPRPQKKKGVLRLVYTSIIDLYKHQWTVAEAAIELREEGVPLELALVGPSYGPALRKLERVLRRDKHHIVRVRGGVAHADLPEIIQAADVFVFASTCENMPNILLEAMASGLPIACSSREPMPRFLQDGGVYFDPENKDDVKRALRELLDPKRRGQLAKRAYDLALQYSWERCANETFTFLAEVARTTGNGQRTT